VRRSLTPPLRGGKRPPHGDPPTGAREGGRRPHIYGRGTYGGRRPVRAAKSYPITPADLSYVQILPYFHPDGRKISQ